MILSFTAEVVRDVGVLRDLPAALFDEFCGLAARAVLSDGAGGPKAYAAAAKQLGVEPAAVRAAVEGLAQMLLECAKRALPAADVRASVEEVGFSAEQQAALSERYEASLPQVRQYLADASLQLPHYAGLSWRLDVQLASRCLRKQVEPKFLIRLETRGGGAGGAGAGEARQPPQERLLEADYASLRHVVDQLESAARQAHVSHSKRVLRYV